MSKYIPVYIVNGVIFGASFAFGNEIFKIYRGGIKKCQTCQAPVGTDGKWRGEREPRSFSIAWTIHPKEWSTPERIERRKKCFGCKKGLDSTSVIVLDRAWHRKCLKCHLCNNTMSGNRYYMIDNQVYDSNCYNKVKHGSPSLRSPKTSIIDYQIPAPIESESTTDSKKTKDKRSGHRFSFFHRNDSHHYSVNHDETGKMSQEMKRKLANDLLNTIMSLRIRESRKKSQNELSTLKPTTKDERKDTNIVEDNSGLDK